MANKFVIFTTIVGGYDVVKQPLVVDERFDYILFTDDLSNKKIGVWDVRAIPYEDDNLVKLSRYPKLMPTKVLPEYEASLYIDGTLQIATSYVYEKVIELYNNAVDWAGVTHYQRDCSYDEMCVIVGEFPKGVHDYDTIEWYVKLKKEGFPKHFGLYENNVIYRNHNEKITKIGDEWWASMQQYCKRDQFSLMYLLWKNPVKMDYILDKGIDTKHTQHFIYHYHKTPRKNVIMGFHERLRLHCWLRTKRYADWYGYVIEEASKLPFTKIALYEWEVYALIRFMFLSRIKNFIKSIL